MRRRAAIPAKRRGARRGRSIEGKPIDDAEIAPLLGGLTAAPLRLGDDDDFRISVAGAQEKTALLRWKGKWFKPTGTAATTHILKPQIGKLPNGIDMSCSVENEFVCLKLAAALGLPSATVEIATFGEKRCQALQPPLDPR